LSLLIEVSRLGVYSSIWIFYGFLIPNQEFENLLRFCTVDSDDYNGDGEFEYYVADENYTHEIWVDVFIYGKKLYHTEAREYIWGGNREVVDLKRVLKIHHMQKKKIDKMATKCGTEATCFAVAVIS
jgi:hypothetical protein